MSVVDKQKVGWIGAGLPVLCEVCFNDMNAELVIGKKNKPVLYVDPCLVCDPKAFEKADPKKLRPL